MIGIVRMFEGVPITINLDFSNVGRFGSVSAVVDGRLAVWIGYAACLNPLIVGSRDTSPLAAIFPAYVSVRSRLGVRPSAGPALPRVHRCRR